MNKPNGSRTEAEEPQPKNQIGQVELGNEGLLEHSHTH